MNIFKVKNNALARSATKKLADHYAKMFAQISLQEGLTSVSDLRDFILYNMSVDDFCDYVFLNPIDVSSSDVLPGGDSDD